MICEVYYFLRKSISIYKKIVTYLSLGVRGLYICCLATLLESCHRGQDRRDHQWQEGKVESVASAPRGIPGADHNLHYLQ